LDAVAQIPGDFQVRVGMMSPQTLRPIAPEHFAALNAGRFFRFLHLPVQSGSDAILESMRRGYTARESIDLIRMARDRVPNLALATDMIVGYPGESDDDFRATCDFLRACEPEIVNVTRFSARPLTPAARLRPVASSVAKERSRALAALRRRLARTALERRIGQGGWARVVEVDADGNRIGRMANYLPVVLANARGVRLGERIGVRVEGATNSYLLGRATDLDPAESRSAVGLNTASHR
jgi:tRNA A37 methylthiotransferase MiaB